MNRRAYYRPLRGLGRLGAAAALDPATIQQLAVNAGFTGQDVNTAVAIALAESGGVPNGVPGDQNLAPTNGPSYGLWQINIGSKANPQFASWNLTDPQTNANAAFAIYSAWGNSFGAWTTYTGGKYLAFLAQVPPLPLTIDASTGQPITDATPTPDTTVDDLEAAAANAFAPVSASPLIEQLAVVAGLGIAGYIILEDLL